MKIFGNEIRTLEWDPENPVITCLMAVYNGETYLREAIDSILDQTFTNFEFLIINDGSTDETIPIIESYYDPRIRLVHNEENIGLTKSLNKGIDLSKGKYIARMDADDVCISERFALQMGQIGPMDIHYSIVSDVSPELTEQKKLAAFLLFENPIIHSSVTVKSEVLKLNKYNSEIKFAQDYDLWSKLISEYGFKGTSESLVSAHDDSSRIGKLKFHEQKEYGDEVRFQYLNKLGLRISEDEKKIFSRICSTSPGYSYEFYHKAMSLLEKVRSVRNSWIDGSYLNQLIKSYEKVLKSHYSIRFNLRNGNLPTLKQKTINGVIDYFK